MDGNFYQLELLDALRQDGDLVCRVQVPWHQKNFFATERVDEAVEMRARYNDDMPMRRQRTFCNSASGSLRRSTPSSRISPPVTQAGGLDNRVIA